MDNLFPRRSLWLSSAVLLGVMTGSAHASLPGDYQIERMPQCTDAALGQPCVVAVPNGDFEGFDGDPYWHGEFRWLGVGTEKHSMASHMRPWAIGGPGRAAYEEQMAIFNASTTPARVARLAGRGDTISQHVVLPPEKADGEDGPEDHIYTLHAHVSAEMGTGTVTVAMAVKTGEQRHGYEERQVPVRRTLSASGSPTGEAIVSVRVPAGLHPDRIGVLIENEDGSAAIRVDDVAVIRSWAGTLPDADIGLTPP